MKFLRNSMNKALRKPTTLLAGLLAVSLCLGCKTVTSLPDMPEVVKDMGPAYHPNNFYRRSNFLPPEIKRVALLPLTITTSSDAVLEAGAESLGPIVYAELEKAKRFEVIPVTKEQMKQWTGQNNWRADEQLPPNLFQAVHDGTGCDAVIFCQLARYQPYQPVAVGWKFSLIETPHGDATNSTPLGFKPSIIWSIDEVLDSGDPEVATAARIYYTQHIRNESPAADVSTMMSSPVRFGQYTLDSLLGTLPERPGQKK
jgi:hypothetical protein